MRENPAEKTNHMKRNEIERDPDMLDDYDFSRGVRGKHVQRFSEGKESEPVRTENELLQRITVNSDIFGGKPIIRGRRLAAEHILGMLAAGDDFDTILEGYPWLERKDILACLAYARRLVANETIEPLIIESVA